MVKAEWCADSGQRDIENVYFVAGWRVINGYCKYKETLLFGHFRNVIAGMAEFLSNVSSTPT